MKCPKMMITRIMFILAVAAVRTSCQNNPITFQLEEEQAADTPIGNVAEESGLQSTMTSEEFQNLRYQILSSDGLRITSLVTINSRTGALLTNAMIDREQVCDSSTSTCTLQFDVTVKSDLAVIRLLNVVVEITDKNDNAPTFPSSTFPLTIPEDSPVASEFLINGAVDRDAGLDSTISYWMDESDIFRLREERLLDASVLYLALNQKLDRETMDAYQLQIYAKDGNTSTSLTGTLSVSITVGDTNDHDPEFLLPTYNFTVKENAVPGNFVGKLEATDLDIHLNGQIRFNFSSLTSSRVLNLFRLDHDSGDIFVKSTLQYESNQEFRAVVEAKDKGETPRASQAILIISVVDAGNTPPRLSLTLAELLYQDTTLLSESLPIGSFVGTLKYTDNDNGDNGRVECQSLNAHFDLQSLEDSGYGIEIKTRLDRETESEMTVQLQCSDHGNPSLAAYVNFTVLVKDINDNHPVFTKSRYTASVLERVTIENNIVRVSATDRDEGDNGDVTYQLTANSSNAFKVDPFTGWISLKSPVDREASPTILLTLLAIDNGDERKTGSVTVTVAVEDINDNSPEIVRKEYYARENANAIALVSEITAVDRDEGVNGEVKFSLLSDPADSFTVSQSGSIYTKAVLDRESVPFYLIVVQAKDNGDPALTTTSSLSIFVTDVNDHAPVMIFPTPGNDTTTISANLSPGSFVAKVMATDDDVGKNSKLMYLIAEGNPHKIFSIDNVTGTVFVANRLNMVRQTSYHLTISVQDGGNPRQHTKAFLNVKIDFTNATMYSDSPDLEHKYVIIAGVISGITVVVAVVVIAIIIKLRHAEMGHGANAPAKVKTETRSAGGVCKVSDYIAQPVSGFKVDQTDRDAGFEPNKANKKDSTSSFSHQLANGTGTYCNRSAMTQDYVNRHSGSVYQGFPEGRQRLTSEDIHSNTSNETATSDSGRGASDAEENANAAFQQQQQQQQQQQLQSIRPATSSSSSYVPTIPPREPFTVAMGTNPAGTTSFQALPVYTNGVSGSQDFISRAARAYASHKELDKSKRPGFKVRFSLDDHSVGNSTYGHPNTAHLNPAASPIEMNIKPSSLPSPHGNALNDLSYSSGFSSAPSTRSADGGDRRMAAAADRGRQFAAPGTGNTPPQYNNQDGGNVRSRGPNHQINLSTVGGGGSGGIPSVHRGLTGNLTGNPRLLSNQPNVLYSKQQHPMTGSKIGIKDSSYPLLRPHHLPSRSTLSSLNHSVDEDDDDGSTTTSGSYAIEDNLSISVEC